MSNYRRAQIAGGCFFFTVVTHGRRPMLADADIVARLREAFRRTREKYPFRIDAIVVLPDHVHAIWWLPEGDADFSLRWRLIKHFVAVGIGGEPNQRGEKPAWQRRFWEHALRDETDWRNHVDYIHYNPVKHGHARRPGDWPHGSFRRAVDAGWYPPGWGETAPSNIASMDLD